MIVFAPCLLLTIVLSPNLRSQEPAPVDTQLARAAFDNVHAGRKQFLHLKASYEQHRTTPLSKKPLVSSGTMLFRRDPGCLVFEAELPRTARILLDTTRYQVYRPETRQLERYLLEDSALARALFDALSGRLTALEADFKIVRCARDPEDARIVEVALEPKEEDVRRAVTRLWVSIKMPPEQKLPAGKKQPDPKQGEQEERDPLEGETKERERKEKGDQKVERKENAEGELKTGPRGELLWIAYRDAQGDRVEIRLTNLTVDPKLSADAFEVEPPKGTRILEQKVPARRDGP